MTPSWTRESPKAAAAYVEPIVFFDADLAAMEVRREKREDDESFDRRKRRAAKNLAAYYAYKRDLARRRIAEMIRQDERKVGEFSIVETEPVRWSVIPGERRDCSVAMIQAFPLPPPDGGA